MTGVRRSTRGVVAYVLNCDIVIDEFELQSLSDCKWMNSLSLLFFYKNSFSIK